MDHDEIRAHWKDWATTYGTSLRATTKTSTAKALELDALTRAFRRVMAKCADLRNVLEVGCGNGVNCLHLAEAFPGLRFTGLDFIPEMVEAARIRCAEANVPADRLDFLCGDLLDSALALEARYDLVFTDRCLINLNTDALQCQALERLCGLLPAGGHLLMIENNQETYGHQNRAREMVGLPPRVPASFNHFFDEAVILPFLETSCGMEILDVEDFVSLHDLVLYVLVPAFNGGEVDYDHPLVQIATTLNRAMSNERPGAFGAFGQNRLYLCRKKQ